MGRFNAAEKANLDIILAMRDANSAARFVKVGNAVTDDADTVTISDKIVTQVLAEGDHFHSAIEVSFF